MKLLLENWRKLNAAAEILDNIPDWSIVKKDDELFLFSGRDLRPLDHIDIGTFSGIVEKSAHYHAGGIVHVKRTDMLDQLEANTEWIKLVLDPAAAEKITDQFELLRNKIMKRYKEEGVAGPLFTDKFKRDHPVEIDLENLTVALV